MSLKSLGIQIVESHSVKVFVKLAALKYFYFFYFNELTQDFLVKKSPGNNHQLAYNKN